MRQVLAVAALAAVVVVVAASPANAAATKGPTLRSLQAQLTSLKKQVTTLKKRVNSDENVIAASLVYSGCLTSVTADTFQDTWTSLDAGFVTKSGTPYFGAQTPLNDYQTCQALEIARTHNQHPATTAVLGALTNLFKPGSSAAAKDGLMNLAGQRGYAFGQLFVLLR